VQNARIILKRANTYRAEIAEANEINVWTSHTISHTVECKEAKAPESLHSAYISYVVITSLPLRQSLPRNLLPVYF
jgi:hypothetical protein